MSWPHILSFSRVLAGPVVAVLILAGSSEANFFAAIVFALASVTDLVDGKLARYSRSVSALGVFLDTTSDKVLVGLTLVAMAIAGLAPGWVVLAIIGREFLISGLRSYAASCDRIISAHVWGKGKAAITMVAIVCVLLADNGRSGGVLSTIGPHHLWSALFTGTIWLLGLSAVLTLISGTRYVVDAWALFRPHRAVGEARADEHRRAVGDRA
jgi:CDP-diacylglycerol--glycerol-3-phosphate 3-phosphatidyltransferase